MISALKDPAQIEQMKLLFLGAGFAVVWLGIAGYLMSIARRQANLERRVDEMRSRSRGSELDADGHSGALDDEGPRL